MEEKNGRKNNMEEVKRKKRIRNRKERIWNKVQRTKIKEQRLKNKEKSPSSIPLLSSSRAY
jgi:hypothetical protein